MRRLAQILLLGLMTSALHAEPVAAPQWEAGVHFSVLAPAQETRVPVPKVEVLELFMYTSPLSRDLQPHLEKWLQNKSDYIEYRREPSIVFPHAAYQARMFYTLKELGREDLHGAFWQWVFEKDHYPVYHTIRKPDVAGYARLNLDFAELNGIDPTRFLATYHSEAMDERVISAGIAAHSYHVIGTSTLVINGKYCVSVQRLVSGNAIRHAKPEDFGRLFALIDHLAALERAANPSIVAAAMAGGSRGGSTIRSGSNERGGR